MLTRLILYAEEEGAGPLATLYAQTSTAAAPQASAGEEDEGDERRGESAVGEAHEVIANVTLGLVIFHILGVLLASFVHHENLARAMVTGRKRPD